MNKYRSEASSILYRLSFIGLLIISLTVFFFLTKSAEMQSSSVSSEQNLAIGRLAFTGLTIGMSTFQMAIQTSNPDGTGRTVLPATGTNYPAWSPDGIKIAFVAGSPFDIHAINADGTGQVNLTNSGASESNPSWSVTGKIAYERDSQIWTMNADGSGQALFTAITQPSPSGPTWSADGTKLAFTSGGEIWVINADGTNEQRVTMTAAADRDPAWSPDGLKIVFTKGTSGVSVINADGTNETPLTSGLNDGEAAWSPDGTKIAFRRENNQSGLYTMDPNGANLVRIIGDTILFPTPCCDTVYHDPAWQPVAQAPNTFTISGRITKTNASLSGVTVNLSGTTSAATTTDAVGNYQFSGLPAGGNYTISPSLLNNYFTPPNRSFTNLDGNKIADFTAARICAGFVCAQNGKIAFVRNGEIFTINPDGTGLTNITNNAANDNAPNWSPDGVKIAFSTFRDGNNEIYRLNSEDDTNPTRLTNNPFSDTSPYYSPDGSTIVFVSDRDGNSEIYKMNADGSNQVRLTNNTSSDTQPAFSPDGQKIVFVSIAPFPGPKKLFTMNADGSDQQAIPDNSTPFSSYERPSYSPDGSKITFTFSQDVQSQFRTGWTMNPDGTNRTQGPAGGLSGAYSPDGTKITHVCCIFDNSYRLRTINVNGTSELSLTTNSFPPNSPDLPDWQPLPAPRRQLFDFDGDGLSDISFFRQTDRIWYLLQSRSGFAVFQWGLSDDVLAPADYDGDLKTDIAVWRGSDGNFYVLNSFDGTVRVENFGLSGDVPTGGDFDGDGKADLAVYRGGAQGIFYYRASMGNPNGNITSISWGTTDDKPVAGDYDGDGLTDAAVFRPSSGVWYIRKSSDGQMSGGAFGLETDTLVPADYDADGKTDLAVYRGGVWYILRTLQGFTAFHYGIATDTPVPADYDGDGRADLAVFRDGVWYVLKTQSGTTEITNFGTTGDKPIPAVYVR